MKVLSATMYIERPPVVAGLVEGGGDEKVDSIGPP